MRIFFVLCFFFTFLDKFLRQTGNLMHEAIVICLFHKCKNFPREYEQTNVISFFTLYNMFLKKTKHTKKHWWKTWLATKNHLLLFLHWGYLSRTGVMKTTHLKSIRLLATNTPIFDALFIYSRIYCNRFEQSETFITQFHTVSYQTLPAVVFTPSNRRIFMENVNSASSWTNYCFKFFYSLWNSPNCKLICVLKRFWGRLSHVVTGTSIGSSQFLCLHFIYWKRGVK